MFLIDTNCWIQLVRHRTRSAEVKEFFFGVPLNLVFVSNYAVHGIGNVMLRHGMIDQYEAFLKTTKIGTEIRIISVPLAELGSVAKACINHKLDFDDAFQYITAELHGLAIVSLDADFDRTPMGRLTPAQALQRFKDEQQKQK